MKQRLPVTTQENFTLQFSDTAFDLRVVSKEGCVSSVNCAIILQSVLLCEKREPVSRAVKVFKFNTALLLHADEQFSDSIEKVLAGMIYMVVGIKNCSL